MSRINARTVALVGWALASVYEGVRFSIPNNHDFDVPDFINGVAAGAIILGLDHWRERKERFQLLQEASHDKPLSPKP